MPYYATGVDAQYWRTTHAADTRWYIVPDATHMKQEDGADEADSRWNLRKHKYYISMIPGDTYYGERYKYHEINYIAQGWISAYRGEALNTLFLLIRGWKFFKYHEQPNNKTLYIAQIGWEMYHNRRGLNVRDDTISKQERTKMRQLQQVIRDDKPR